MRGPSTVAADTAAGLDPGVRLILGDHAADARRDATSCEVVELTSPSGRVTRIHDVWDERIGTEAAAMLARRAKLSRVPVGRLAATSLFATALHGAAYWVAEVLLLPAIVWFFYMLRCINRQIADTLSQHLGSPVDPRQLPSFRSTDRFDKWLAVREGRAERRTVVSSPSGFFKITLPPK